MKLIVGLGNPGESYKRTRHNLGFMVVDALLEELGVSLKANTKAKLQEVKLHLKEEDTVLCKPLTYMNLSGGAVLELARRYSLKAEDILVICDDIHLALGRIKIRAKGSSGGHNGVESIIQSLRTKDFPRLRVGIACSVKGQELSTYVLSKFSAKEKEVIRNSVKRAKEAVLCWLEEGIKAAMNKFNSDREIENG